MVTPFDLKLIGATGVLLFSFIFLFFKEIQAIIGQRQAALAAGIPAKSIYYASILLMGLVVAFALKAIGGLLIFSLIVTPAATAFQLTYNLRWMFVLAALFGAVGSSMGLWLSFHLALPPGAAIVLVAVCMLLLAMAFSPKKKTPAH